MVSSPSIAYHPSIEELLQSLREKLPPIFQKFGVEFAYLGGSWARHEQQWWSDVDLFVSWPSFSEFAPKEILKKWIQINVEASDAIGIEPIEISFLEKIPPHVQYRVIKEGILIYERTHDLRINFVEKLLSTCYDYMIWYQSYLNQAMQNAMISGNKTGVSEHAY
ncbi:MAG TPA: nucleotidyltransferase domain-containing protein [Candidatus Lokiarchaeia archaeon]|nr:nucleotidyltransferase domain-containing protein [Candidatus Lokiarchaeia archaeon]